MSSQVQTSSANEVKVVDSKNSQVIDTVRKTVFPTATDPELLLFFHKCETLGVHPLAGMVHPMKFNTKDGPKVSFIVSIDLLRSRSNDTGLYDGMDEPEYDGKIDQKLPDGGVLEAPEVCKVRVYRKDISRPFIGIARWKEFYPGDVKGAQWRNKPYLMLAKCAEAQARRLAFPQELNKLYTAEEMQATTEALAGVKPIASSKPVVNPAEIAELPANENKNESKGFINSVSEKAGSGWLRYGITINKKTYGTFDKKIGELAKTLTGKEVLFTSKYDGKFDNIMSIRSADEEIQNVSDDDEFQKLASSLALAAGLTDEELNSSLEAEFGIKNGVKNVPAKDQNLVIDWLTSQSEQAGA